MSRFFSDKYSALTPYTPGEQPRERKFIKLNTNESPFPPSPLALRLAREEAGTLQLYSDPVCTSLVKAITEVYGINEDEVLFTNGSDEALYFAFLAFCDKDHPAVFPDITYGFYPVFAQLCGVPYEEKPLKDDFTVDVEEYIGVNRTVFIANPNAPTGIALSAAEIEKIAAGNPDSVVVIDEAYVDFGGETVIPLIRKYDNLLVIQTFSKSRSLAGARLGFAIGKKELIRDLNTIKYSINPYNVNRVTMAAGVGALLDTEYFDKCRAEIADVRAYSMRELKRLGFEMTDSKTNFIFARHPRISGGDYYARLRERGILVRHFTVERIADYNRITVGSREEMETLISVTAQILEDVK